MLTDGSGLLGELGEVPTPVGTVEEIRKLNLDPKSVGTCAPLGKGTRGCAYYEECPFHRTKWGGFKDHGPRNVGYFLQTTDFKRVEGIVSCYRFVSTLLGRMKDGNRAREDGKNGEIIRIIAQEGEKIAAKYQVRTNLDRPNDPPKFEWFKGMIEVPKFPRPGEGAGIDQDDLIRKRMMLRMELEDDNAVGLPQGIVADDDNEPLPGESVQVEPAPEGIVARPVGAKK